MAIQQGSELRYKWGCGHRHQPPTLFKNNVVGRTGGAWRYNKEAYWDTNEGVVVICRRFLRAQGLQKMHNAHWRSIAVVFYSSQWLDVGALKAFWCMWAPQAILSTNSAPHHHVWCGNVIQSCLDCETKAWDNATRDTDSDKLCLNMATNALSHRGAHICIYTYIYIYMAAPPNFGQTQFYSKNGLRPRAQFGRTARIRQGKSTKIFLILQNWCLFETRKLGSAELSVFVGNRVKLIAWNKVWEYRALFQVGFSHTISGCWKVRLVKSSWIPGSESVLLAAEKLDWSN